MDTSIIVPAISIVASAPVIGVGSVWIVKSWLTQKIKSEVQHQYDLKLEGFKQNLIAEKTKEIEELKSQLTITASASNFKFTHYYEKMSKAIIEINEAIYFASESLITHLNQQESRIKGMLSQTNLIPEESNKVLKVSNQLVRGRLFLSEEAHTTGWELFSILNELFQIWTDVLNKVSNQKAWIGIEAERTKRKRQLIENFNIKYNELQKEFKELLGYSDKLPATS